MDELKAKMKKLSLFGSKSGSSGAFKGAGHRLGSASTQAGASAGRQAAAPAPAVRRPVLNVPPPTQAQQPPRPSPTLQGPAAQFPPQQQLQPTPLPPPQPQPQQQQLPRQQQQQQQQQPGQTQPFPASSELADEQAPEDVHVAVVQLASDPAGAAAAEVLSKLLRNITAAPGEAKFRRIRLSNPRIEAAVVHVSGGVELLLACGFEILFEEGAAGSGAGGSGGEAAGGEAGGTTEGYAVLPGDADLEPLQHALRLLAPLLPAGPGEAVGSGKSSSLSSSLSSSSALPAAVAAPAPAAPPPPPQQARPAKPPRQWEGPRERNTQVVLPTSVERDVPEWFFQRTGAELKASFMAAVRRREQDKVLMTRAMRERLQRGGGSGAPPPKFATIRVRFPEGISLQGEFGAGEPVAAVFAWVADCLSDPLHTYELVLPSRQTLEVKAQSVREADLLPSVALLFRWTGQSAVDMAQAPALRPELLRAARPTAASY